MRKVKLLLAWALILVGLGVHAAVVEHTFNVGEVTVRRLCNNKMITAVNGKLPGPTIHAHEGDTLIIHVLNNSPFNISIHWHGIFQRLTGWADGPSYITQCPIVPGKSYTYKFTITGQEGSLWWHAHVANLRSTVYGALIIRPKAGTKAYPFPRPYKEVPIILGEWWNARLVDVEREIFLTGGVPVNSDAFTINGRPGDLYPCSKKHTYSLKVVPGETYMLRIINAALNHQLFFKVAGHTLTVVAVDACYTTPYTTDVVVTAPGQTVDVLLHADAPPGRYYMAASAYMSFPNVTFDNTTTTAILHYKTTHPSSVPLMPIMPKFYDTPTAHRFYSSLLGLIKPGLPTVPLHVDDHLFVAFGLGLVPCTPGQTKCKGFAFAASMNNVSFKFPTKMSLLEAHYKHERGVFSEDFPSRPPVEFNFTSNDVNVKPELAPLMFTAKGTKVRRVRYNATVEVVLQNTAVLGPENHPVHLHGFNFFVLAQGFGNFDEGRDRAGFNLVHPQVRNTIAVPAGGWAVIRFIADNPGIWIMHCHLEDHLPIGLAMAFQVENGPTPSSILPPPPPDFPTC